VKRGDLVVEGFALLVEAPQPTCCDLGRDRFGDARRVGVPSQVERQLDHVERAPRIAVRRFCNQRQHLLVRLDP
jgi:hypothetical protein